MKVISNSRIPESYFLTPHLTVLSNIPCFPTHGKRHINNPMLHFTREEQVFTNVLSYSNIVNHLGLGETQKMFQSVLLLRSRESSVLVLLGSHVHWWGARASQGFNTDPEERLSTHKVG